MDIWLFLLILVSLLIGWVFGRWTSPARQKTNQNKTLSGYSESYARGLNYLLTDESDKAIRAFTELVEIDHDTIEIHITLGNLFRSKGEVDRAIKIHQNLLARPNLTRNQRSMAVTELASDYLKAGLHDRAEKLFREMTQLKANDMMAYHRLLDLYIAERSWYEACDCAQILYDHGEPDAGMILSQVHCEIAQLELSTGNRKLTRVNLNKALEIDDNCVRAGLLLIELHLTTGDFTAARKLLQRLIKQSPEHMVLYIEPARSIYLHGKESKVYQNFLEHQYKINPSNRLAIALLEHYVRNNHIDMTREFLEEILRQSPSFAAFDFALQFLKSEPEQLSDTWQSLSEFLKNMQSKKIEFTCANCGYGSHTIQWNCPSCRSWSSMKAV
ncbi:MAG: tetratricopeptide repeat protein [Gammaproteobacteria bacterium]|nr:tetratricopeptide repeat protein [Gammaproteobacteria bacterium]